MITQKQVKELFYYKDGKLIRRSQSGGRLAGTVAGCFSGDYGVVKIKNKPYKIHRVIYLYFYGYLPELIDHIDNNPLNNKIENLRECTRGQNKMNCKVSKNNPSGVKGVSWNKDNKKWAARIRINGRDMFFGYFDNIESAAKVISKKRPLYHGEFARD